MVLVWFGPVGERCSRGRKRGWLVTLAMLIGGHGVHRSHSLWNGMGNLKLNKCFCIQSFTENEGQHASTEPSERNRFSVSAWIYTMFLKKKTYQHNIFMWIKKVDVKCYGCFRRKLIN